jgi:hypothetical protein
MYIDQITNEIQLKHFLFKSKSLVQFTQSPIPHDMDKEVLVRKYAKLHASMHDRECPTRLIWLEGDQEGESILGWVCWVFSSILARIGK